MHHVDPDALSFMVAVLMVCVTAYVSIVKKVMKKRKPISKLWLSHEIMLCLLVLLMALEAYPHIAVVLPAFITKAIFVSICVHMSSKVVMMLEERVTNSLKN